MELRGMSRNDRSDRGERAGGVEDQVVGGRRRPVDGLENTFEFDAAIRDGDARGRLRRALRKTAFLPGSEAWFG
jgi:hypothetical protein